MMTLTDRLAEDLKKAMRAQDVVRVSTIRLVRAAIQNATIERGRPLTDAEVVELLGREIKRRREAIDAFTKGGRDDLVRKESLELAILTEYLPPQLSEDELRALITEVAKQLQVKDSKDAGRVMAAVMPRVKGRADGSLVGRLVNQHLSRSS
jgi:uncharacterized protein